MPASMKDIKLRIKSVQGTMQITKAMELVASSKLRRARQRVEHSRPYFETLYRTLCDMAAAEPRLDSPYLVHRSSGQTCYVVVAGDRGLAGAAGLCALYIVPGPGGPAAAVAGRVRQERGI